MKWTTNKEKYYWNDPAWFEARNEALIKDKKEGMSGTELVKKYNITQAGIYRILKSYKRRQEK